MNLGTKLCSNTVFDWIVTKYILPSAYTRFCFIPEHYKVVCFVSLKFYDPKQPQFCPKFGLDIPWRVVKESVTRCPMRLVSTNITISPVKLSTPCQPDNHTLGGSRDRVNVSIKVNKHSKECKMIRSTGCTKKTITLYVRNSFLPNQIHRKGVLGLTVFVT